MGEVILMLSNVYVSKGKKKGVTSVEATPVKGRGFLVIIQGGQVPLSKISQVVIEGAEGGKGLSNCGLSSQVCFPNLKTFVEGQPLALAFVLNSLSISFASTFHLVQCRHVLLDPLELSLAT